MKKTHFNRKQCFKAMEYISNNDVDNLIKYLDNEIKTGIAWTYEYKKFRKFLINLNNDNYNYMPYTIFTQGNNKLSYLSFSTLPVINCPGASECLNYCYSLKAFRYPGAFFRQCQNTLLMQNNFNLLGIELNKYNIKGKLKNTIIDFRLYVDGDFKNDNDLINWMSLLNQCKNINAYGYSKSKHLFLELYKSGFKFPNNYKLNLSNGSKYDFLDNDLLKLHFVRGKFTAYKFNKKIKIKNLTNDNKKELRSAFNNKVFICPGICDTCTNKGHFCGSNNNLEVVIPVH